MIPAVILAAGASTRMGRPKALLAHADGRTTFVAHAIRAARGAGVPTVLVVGRAGDHALQDEVKGENAVFVPNLDPEAGQLSSLLAGLREAQQQYGAEAVLVIPVDVPLISAAVIQTLLTTASNTSATIIRAAHGGHHGHPVLFKRAVFDELRSADPAAGAKAVVRADPSRVLDVEVGDPGVTVDVDTPDDYRRAFGRSI